MWKLLAPGVGLVDILTPAYMYFLKETIVNSVFISHTQFQLHVATLNINREHKTVESSKLYYLIN
jgi:hypothetical protein